MTKDEFGNHVPPPVLARLLEALGGTRLYLPKDPDRTTGRASLARELLGEHWPAFHAAARGESVLLPVADAGRCITRDALIRKARAAGEAVDDIARAFGLTRRRVQQIVAAGRREVPVKT